MSNLRQLAVATITYDKINQSLMTQGRANFARRGFLRESPAQAQVWGNFAFEYLNAPKGLEDKSKPGDCSVALRFYSSDVFHCPLNPVESANEGDAEKGRITDTGGSNYGFFSGSSNDISFNILKLQAKFAVYKSQSGNDVGDSMALWGDVCNRDPDEDSNWAFVKTNHKKLNYYTPSSKEEADQMIEGGNVAHADGSTFRYRYNSSNWDRATYSRPKSGSLDWVEINPVTAMYPSIDYPSGNFKTTHGYIVGPFNLSGP